MSRMRPDNASKAFDVCWKANEFIIKFVIDLGLLAICKDELPFPTMNNLDQIKEEYEQRIVEVMVLNMLDKVVIENFVVALARKCAKI